MTELEKLRKMKGIIHLAMKTDYGGRNTAANVGKAAGALRKIGRRSLYDREAIDKYIDSLA